MTVKRSGLRISEECIIRSMYRKRRGYSYSLPLHQCQEATVAQRGIQFGIWFLLCAVALN